MENYLSVTALTKYLKAKLEGDKHLVSIYIKGEISNFKHHSRGHFYFTLKDEQAQISCIMFSNYVKQVTFSPKDGDHVLLQGRMSVYEAGGSYSIQVAEMKLDGIGELYLKYEALKKDLTDKGYFDQSHKKAIPKFPKKIGVVTSPTGAVIEDIKNTVTRRYLLSEIHLYPALVQGPDSSTSIHDQIVLANKLGEVDVLIVGRGGGSIEDLWGFNELPAIMAIFESKIPVITAIGHETDFTLCDFVSDLRAPTPTAAAELATPNKSDLLEDILYDQDLIKKSFHRFIEQNQTKLVHIDQRLDVLSPIYQVAQSKKDLYRFQLSLERNYVLKLEDLKNKVIQQKQMMRSPLDHIKHLKDKHLQSTLLLKQNIQSILELKAYQYRVNQTALKGLNPLTYMDKGFAYIEKENHVISSVKDISVNDEIKITLKDGKVDTKVIHKEEN
ncbi:MAG: exodeoxyribonuclease VII large subunit [Acholeplasmataceae bacterium]